MSYARKRNHAVKVKWKEERVISSSKLLLLLLSLNIEGPVQVHSYIDRMWTKCGPKPYMPRDKRP